jgi:hypothetical protein
LENVSNNEHQIEIGDLVPNRNYELEIVQRPTDFRDQNGLEDYWSEPNRLRFKTLADGTFF